MQIKYEDVVLGNEYLLDDGCNGAWNVKIIDKGINYEDEKGRYIWYDFEVLSIRLNGRFGKSFYDIGDKDRFGKHTGYERYVKWKLKDKNEMTEYVGFTMFHNQ